MTGRERVARILAGQSVDRLPVLPILHTGFATILGVSLGDFFSSAETMARVMVEGCREFGFDGVQLSSGVTAEAEAFGARVEQPADGPPILREYLLADLRRLDALRAIDPSQGGRMPLFFEAVARVVSSLGDEGFVLATLRGPLLAAAQLRGIKQILLDTVDHPREVEAILDFTAETALHLGKQLLASGAHGLILGEATCSPNFISPALYRRLVLPRHRALIGRLKEAGWQAVGIHICGDTTPIIEDIVSTGADFMDVDYQISPEAALARAGGRIAQRGNLDPASLLRFGTPKAIEAATAALRASVTGTRWILSTGCDIPPATPAANVRAFATAARS